MSTATLKEISTFACHKEAVTSLAVSEEGDSKILLSSSRDKSVLCWSLAADKTFGRILKEIKKHGHGINSVSVAKSCGYIVTACSDTFGRIIDLRETDKATILRGHSSDVLCSAINTAENKILTGSVDRSIKLWNTEGLLLKRFEPGAPSSHSDWVNCIEFKPCREDEFVSGSADGTVKMWDISTGTVQSTFFRGGLHDEEKCCGETMSDGSYAVRAVALSADGSLCAYGGNDSKVYILNLTGNDLINVFGTDSPVTSLAFGLTEVVVACGTKHSVYILDVTSNDLLASVDLAKYGGNVSCKALAWSSDNLIVGLSNGKIVVFEFVRQ